MLYKTWLLSSQGIDKTQVCVTCSPWHLLSQCEGKFIQHLAKESIHVHSWSVVEENASRLIAALRASDNTWRRYTGQPLHVEMPARGKAVQVEMSARGSAV